MARRQETQEAKAERKAAKKAVKEAKRMQRQGISTVPVGQRPCTLCSRERDLLVRWVIKIPSRHE
jgi:hypothetical protein